MDSELDRLEASLANVGCGDWLLPPATADEIAAVVEAVAPFFVPAELIDLWWRHAGVQTRSPYVGWFVGWSTPAQVVERREQWAGIAEHFPGTWPYWNDDRWLPIATEDRDTFFVVLDDEPHVRSLVGVHSSSALDIRVQQSSLRSWVLSLDLVVRALGDLGVDPRAEEVLPYGWWDTMELHDDATSHFPSELAERLRADLPDIAAIDAAATWPEPVAFRVGTGDPLGGPWMAPLGVSAS